MNKFQKIATQMAKDDKRKIYYKDFPNLYHFKNFKAGYLQILRSRKMDIKNALGFKNKNKEWIL